MSTNRGAASDRFGGSTRARLIVARWLGTGDSRWVVLKYMMFFIGICVMAPVAVIALLISLPFLPVVLVGWLIYRLLRSRVIRFTPAFAEDRPMLSIQSRHLGLAVLPLLLAVVLVTTVVQIGNHGFSWSLDRWLLAAMFVLALAWWLQHRLFVWHRNRTHGATTRGVRQHDLYRLFEVERANDPNERRVLIARELNRLTREALRPDPSQRASWPSVADLIALRDQARLLRSSLNDPVTSAAGSLDRSDVPSFRALRSGIDTLESYVNKFVRLRLIGNEDLEQMRVLVRDQSRLRAMQDGIVEQIQQTTPMPIAG